MLTRAVVLRLPLLSRPVLEERFGIRSDEFELATLPAGPHREWHTPHFPEYSRRPHSRHQYVALSHPRFRVQVQRAEHGTGVTGPTEPGTRVFRFAHAPTLTSQSVPAPPPEGGLSSAKQGPLIVLPPEQRGACERVGRALVFVRGFVLLVADYGSGMGTGGFVRVDFDG